jgi:hypothetical protein
LITNVANYGNFTVLPQASIVGNDLLVPFIDEFLKVMVVGIYDM